MLSRAATLRCLRLSRLALRSPKRGLAGTARAAMSGEDLVIPAPCPQRCGPALA